MNKDLFVPTVQKNTTGTKVCEWFVYCCFKFLEGFFLICLFLIFTCLCIRSYLIVYLTCVAILATAQLIMVTQNGWLIYYEDS